MSFDIHPLMQDPNHIDRVIRFAIEHDVRANCVPKIPIPNNASPTSLLAACQRFHRPDQIPVVVVCLFE